MSPLRYSLNRSFSPSTTMPKISDEEKQKLVGEFLDGENIEDEELYQATASAMMKWFDGDCEESDYGGSGFWESWEQVVNKVLGEEEEEEEEEEAEK